jgi:hypothetical protein
MSEPVRRTPAADLEAWRTSLQKARSSSELIDLLLTPVDAEKRVQSLPAADLYGIIRRIGLEDCTELLPLASPQQFRALLDFDVWQGDEPSLERLQPWLRALMQAGPEVVSSRMLAMDDELLNWTLRQTVEVHVVDDPDSFDPPDAEHVLTQDRRLCIVFPDPGEDDLPVKVALDWLMRAQPEFCYNLLIYSAAALDSTLVEQAYRWRMGRMADLGYVDPHEALVLYTAPRPDQVKQARRGVPSGVPTPALPARWLREDGRLERALAALDLETRTVVLAELAYVANMALAADRVEPWDLDAYEAVVRRLRAGLLLGLSLLAPDADAEREVVATVPLALVFRTGYGLALESADPLRRLRRRGWLAGAGGPVDGVDVAPLRAWAEALTGRHPTLLDGRFPERREECALMRTQAEVIAELVRFGGPRDADSPGVVATAATRLTADLIGLVGALELPSSALEAAHRALFEGGQVREAARAAARPAWLRLGGERAQVADYVLDLLAEELAAQDPTRLEPRFTALWRIAPP